METLRTFTDGILDWGLTFFAIWAAISLGGWLLRLWLSPARGAKQIHTDAQALYSAPHEFAEVEARAFRWADHRYYDQTEAALAALGFRKLGDLEDLSTSRVYPAMRTFIRAMAGERGTISAGIFHLKMRGWYRLLVLCRLLPGHLRSVDFETELSDGTFVATGNSLGKDLSSEIPGIARLGLPDATPLAELLAAHREHLARILGERPGASARRVESLADDLALQGRMQELKNRHKAAQGFVDLEQFDRCTPAASNPDAQDLTEQMRRHLAHLGEEARTGAPR